MAGRSVPADRDVDTLLTASRALVGVAARSLAVLPDDLTLPQFRALVVLDARGSSPIGTLAEELDIHPSTATRLVDRLEGKGLVRREVGAHPEDRRQSYVGVTTVGRRWVTKVTARRREELTRILGGMRPSERKDVAAALVVFAAAAGEVGDASWELGWGS